MENGRVLQCYHCGNHTFMESKSESRFNDFDENGIGMSYHWALYQCPSCNDVTLVQSEHFSEDIDYDGSSIWHKKVLYPGINSTQGLPDKIKNAFESALKTRKIDGAVCALSLRRTLEIMCVEQEATGSDLYNKLRDLSERNILPPVLNEMATILRELGNLAAHADVQYSDQVVDSLIEFTKIILEYVYILPSKLSDIQEHLGEGS